MTLPSSRCLTWCPAGQHVVDENARCGLSFWRAAHPSEAIVGVTLAFMGLTYHLLPKLGFRAIIGRAARWQPGIYGIGQLLHITGLAWSGGYGVQRKTSGGLEQIEQIAGMGLMGLGGLISIIGGILFLVLVYRSMASR